MSESVAAIIYGTHLGIERRFAVIWSQYRKEYPDKHLDIYCNKKLIKLLENSTFKDLNELNFKPLYNNLSESICYFLEALFSLGAKVNDIPLIGKFFFKTIRVFRNCSLGLLNSLTTGKFENYDKVHYVNTWIYPQVFVKGPELIFSVVNTQIGEWLPSRKYTLNAIRKHDVLLECFSPDIARQMREIFTGDTIELKVAPGSALDPARYRVSKKRNLIVFSGRFDEEKNPILFLEAIAEVNAKHPDVEVIMLGRGHMEAQIMDTIQQYELQNTVSIDFVPDPCKILAEALIYVSLQTTNNYPAQALIEAMGCGCYIVASNVGETHLLVSESLGTGVKVNLDSKSIAEAISQALSEKEKSMKKGCNSRELAINKHSPQKFCHYLKSIYHKNEY